jgi:hypothetical protein
LLKRRFKTHLGFLFDVRRAAEIKHLQNKYLKFKGKMEKGFVDTSQEICRSVLKFLSRKRVCRCNPCDAEKKI